MSSTIRSLTPSTWAGILVIVSIIALPVSARPFPLSVLVAALITLLNAVLIDASAPDQAPQLGFVGIALAVSIGASLAKIVPSVSALSSPWLSVVVLFLQALVETCYSLVIIALYVLGSQRVSSSTARVLLFPAIWCTGIAIASGTSPVGLLGTWSPIEGMDVFKWLLPHLGQPSQDWVVALLAILLAQVLQLFQSSEAPPIQKAATHDLLGDTIGEAPAQTLFVNNQAHERQPLLGQNLPDIEYTAHSHGASIPILTAVLALLAAPSVLFPQITHAYPNPVISNGTTAITVACILPEIPNPPRSPNRTTLASAYLAESISVGGRARIHLWPESAAIFENESDRIRFLERDVTSLAQTNEVWVGVSFEDSAPRSRNDPRDMRRNGVSLVGPDGILFTYFKQNLVPFTESFSMMPSDNPPPLVNIDVPTGRYTGRGKNRHAVRRTISVTAGICLDLAHPSLFQSLPSGSSPDLILGPGKTWDLQIGDAMRTQTSNRANEVGAFALWCDSGAGALSGMVGQGEGGVHRGRGSFIRTIGIPIWDNNKKTPTLYARVGGNTFSLAVAWGLVFALIAAKRNNLAGLGAFETSELSSNAAAFTTTVTSSFGQWPTRALEYVRDVPRVVRDRFKSPPERNLIDIHDNA